MPGIWDERQPDGTFSRRAHSCVELCVASIHCVTHRHDVRSVNARTSAQARPSSATSAHSRLHGARSQIVKLGIADRLRSELSARFLWWDLDMIPVAQVELFDPRSDQPVLAIGGSRIRAYGRAFERLSGGGRLASAPDGSSFVTHAMVGARKRSVCPAASQLASDRPGWSMERVSQLCS